MKTSLSMSNSLLLILGLTLTNLLWDQVLQLQLLTPQLQHLSIDFEFHQ